MTNEDAAGTAEPEASLARAGLRALVRREPARHPLVLALVAPLGTELDSVVGALGLSLARLDYSTEVVSLSALLDVVPNPPWAGPLPRHGERDYYEKRMNAGDELRRRVGSGSALAALAVTRLSELRESRPPGVAYVLRSLKHPDEAALLRQVYGDAFSLIGVSSSAEQRREHLSEALAPFDDPRAEAERLIARDEADQAEREFGQNVRETFAVADAYVPIVRGVDTRDDIDRVVDSLFGAPFLTPRFEEEAMKLAADASLRSAALGRQVGAALIPEIGTPIVVGTNEVPKPGGGQYWAGDNPDFRDFKTGADPNPLYTKRLVQEFLERLALSGWLTPDLRDLSGPALLQRALQQRGGKPSILDGARASALIEFTRCLHAEQAAIINAARAGVSTQRSRLFTTTFPCHECTKMIVGAGVIEVVYIEPYPKSLADRLYRDLIDTEPPERSEPGLMGGRVPFRPFRGVSPRRYEAAFRAGERREGDAPRELQSTAAPRTAGWAEVAIAEREDATVRALTTLLGQPRGSTQPAASPQPAPSAVRHVEPGESSAG